MECCCGPTTPYHEGAGGGIIAESYNGALLAEPWMVRTKQDGPFKVFTPFWNAIRERTPERPTLAPENLRAAAAKSDCLEDWELLPKKPDWASGLRRAWRPGEHGAVAQLARFAKTALKTYDTDRDRPALPRTSRMSPYLHWGEMSPRQVWHGIAAGAQSQGLSIHDGTVGAYLRELGWRFSITCSHWPSLQAAGAGFRRFPGARTTGPEGLAAWTDRLHRRADELWHTGWVHNRVRRSPRRS
jgi:deoxyribodipyrimidine photo-lyase